MWLSKKVCGFILLELLEGLKGIYIHGFLDAIASGGLPKTKWCRYGFPGSGGESGYIMVGSSGNAIIVGG